MGIRLRLRILSCYEREIILRADFVLTLGDIRLTPSTTVLDQLDFEKKAGANRGNGNAYGQAGLQNRS
ncbi:MAG TPA: hypothetical protein VHJ56_00415, partial [Candidatus Binatia bacterium]|nr:hypothetical protein [Candidatus Binatia bacterium]